MVKYFEWKNVIKCMASMRRYIKYVTGIYSFEVVFLDSLNEEIKQQILRAGIIIYNFKNNIKK
ncbi:hypothetical protein UT300018_03000 [Clostridium faecium]|uniref:hypothetical protein n=1 Tax=Clostridium butanoliproducens TaxID=2991837 RepID=UPI0024BB485D|nr:hypothetical protein [Clostridium butanoliproducens]